jgi:hypothetical protein
MPVEQTVGRLTFAKVDHAMWLWSIVVDYKGPQDHGGVIFSFAEDLYPDEETVDQMLHLGNELGWADCVE